MTSISDFLTSNEHRSKETAKIIDLHGTDGIGAVAVEKGGSMSIWP